MILFETEQLRLRQCKHGKFLFRINDNFIGRSLDVYGEWCEPEVELLLRLIPEDGTVIDIGAHIGSHSIPFAKKCSSGKVISIEPQKTGFQLLCANIVINMIENIDAIRGACGAKAGTAHVPDIVTTKAFNYGGVSLSTDGKGSSVPLLRVDDLNLEACHLLKIDVEGMECDVLEGSKNTIDNYKPIIFVENNLAEGNPKLYHQIESMGYIAYWHIHSYFNKKNWRHYLENIFSQYQPSANLLAVPKSANVKGDCPYLDENDNWKSALERITRGK